MTYLITGATGLIGNKIVTTLLQGGHTVIALTRDKTKVLTQFGGQVKAVEDLSEIDGKQAIDAVINLAGAPIADARWSQKRKNILEKSRIELTSTLINWLKTRAQKPECLISASAVGWYGDGKSQLLTEDSGPVVQDYAHQLCSKWEQAALSATSLGMRVCVIRTGLVLSPMGGFLQRMLLPFKMGLGGKIGSGHQYMPWIHIEDISNLFIFLSQQNHLAGIFNGTAPHPVSNAVFTRVLAETLHRPAFFPLPASILKLGLGEMASLLLTGQNAIPEKAQAAHFRFAYTDLKPALINVTQSKNDYD